MSPSTPTLANFGELEGVLLEELRQLAKKSKFEVTPRLDDDFIYRFLRARKYDVPKAVENLQKYYRNVNRNLEFLKDVRPSQFTNAFQCGALMPLKGSCRGCRIGVVRARMWDPKAISLKDLQLVALYLAEYASFQTQVQDNGGIIVMDMAGFSMAHIMKLSLKEIRRVASMVQDGTPIKLKEVHLINPHYLMWPLFRLVLSVLKPKIRKRICIHYSLADFHKFIDRKILPRSYDGDVDDTEAFDNKLTELIIKENYPFEDFCHPAHAPKMVFGYSVCK